MKCGSPSALGPAPPQAGLQTVPPEGAPDTRGGWGWAWLLVLPAGISLSLSLSLSPFYQASPCSLSKVFSQLYQQTCFWPHPVGSPNVRHRRGHRLVPTGPLIKLRWQPWAPNPHLLILRPLLPLSQELPAFPVPAHSELSLNSFIHSLIDLFFFPLIHFSSIHSPNVAWDRSRN